MIAGLSRSKAPGRWNVEIIPLVVFMLVLIGVKSPNYALRLKKYRPAS